MSPSRLLLALILTAVLAACGGDDGPGGGDGDGGGTDSGTADSGGGDAGGGDDAGADAGGGGTCGGEVCEPFEFCDSGVCRGYMGCLSMSMCPAGTICRHRFCLPEDSDPDGDGHTADVDCDETNPDINPGEEESCNGIDDNCDEEVDEGDPTELCADDPSGGICMDGSCGCPPGTYDFDDTAPGCECTAMPAGNQGVACSMAIDLGDLNDSGQTVTASGNVLPDDRVVWYKFRGVDAADTSCDNYHVRVRFTDNPDETFAFEIFRGGCDSAECAGMGPFTDYRWATDFRDAAGNGECPCGPDPGTAGVNVCNDDTADYYVRVFRKPGTPVSCAGYTLEATNGVYDS